VLGGLVAAVTGPLALSHGSWLAAYLVLVSGVAQWAMGRARSRVQDGARAHRWGWAQIGCWNVGNAAVIGATLGGAPLVVDLGSALLIAALAIAFHATRANHLPAAERVPPLVSWAYRILLLALAVSIPAGIALSHLRHS
jgi:hypothetical protein